METTAVHQCRECLKTFFSDKALHGHMRLHPDRSYRGVNPPSNAAKSKAAPTKCSTSGSDSGEGSNSDAGKTPETSTPDNAPGRYKQILSFRTELEAFYKDWDTEEYYAGDGSQYEARYIRTLDLEEYDPRFRRFCKRLISEALEEEEEGGVKTISCPTTAMSNGTSNAATKTNARKKRKVSGIERNTSNGGQHTCATCKMTFNSHQALGGHQTLHRKKADASSPKAAKEAVEAKVHICEICERGFENGQALGGHKRLHYERSSLYKSSVKGKVKESRSGSSPASTRGSSGLAANGDGYEHEEGKILPSSNDLAAVQLESEMQVEDEGSKAALQSKLEMQVEDVEDEVGSKGYGFDLNVSINKEADEVVEEGEEKGAMVTNQTHVDPRSNHGHRNMNFFLFPNLD